MPDPLRAALERLPHGPEFRFVDRLIVLDPGRSGQAVYRVPPGQPFLRGHFPGQPLFPGVLLVEAGAQLAGAIAQSDPAFKPIRELKLTALRSVKIYGTARPDQEIVLESRITGRLGNLIQAEARALVEGKLVMSGELVLSGEGPETP